MLPQKAGAGAPKPHPLSGVGPCLGQGCASHGSRGLSEGRLELHHLLFIPVEASQKPLLTLAGLRLAEQAVFCQNQGLGTKAGS